MESRWDEGDASRFEDDDVACLVSTLAGDAFAATTGAQLPIDGGSDRVI